jgi:transcriptional regulator with XRE-family HTH domain
MNSKEINKILGSNIKEIRKKHKKTRREIAKNLNVSTKSLEQWERGEVMIKFSWIVLIANILKICVTDLIPNNFKKKNQ